MKASLGLRQVHKLPPRGITLAARSGLSSIVISAWDGSNGDLLVSSNWSSSTYHNCEGLEDREIEIARGGIPKPSLPPILFKLARSLLGLSIGVLRLLVLDELLDTSSEESELSGRVEKTQKCFRQGR
ncbi:hypothetical protein N658DRAFT_485718 [Parathielavia hyrcaniae]|uniref:Uncharacterized protein n=1 Tax=Parathielavia hyrcaniae TaxID=113614 RepID=A0AAN6Q1F6_9PEZI|nr:hypothetical protein N658DRAFT_485718 [Parathielavia hyrcaniae]